MDVNLMKDSAGMEGGDKVIFNISKYSSQQISDLLVMSVAS